MSQPRKVLLLPGVVQGIAWNHHLNSSNASVATVFAESEEAKVPIARVSASCSQVQVIDDCKHGTVKWHTLAPAASCDLMSGENSAQVPRARAAFQTAIPAVGGEERMMSKAKVAQART